MDEVSCRAFSPSFEALDARGIDREELVRGLPFGLDSISDPQRRVDWDVLVQVCERLEEICNGPEGLEYLLCDHLQPPSFEFMSRLATTFARPRDLYWMGTHWFGRSLFSIIEVEFIDLPGDRVREILRIPWPYRDSPQLFRLLRGTLRATPRLINEADAQVEMELSERQAVYTITPPVVRARRFARLRHFLSARIALRGLIDELSAHQERIAKQAVDLQRINLIGQVLGRHTDGEQVIESLVGVLQTHMPDEGFAIWLRPADEDGPEELARKMGETVGAPTRTHALLTGGRRVGQLEVWERSPDHENRPDLLDRLLPWIAAALDNARTYSSLRDRVAALEHELSQRDSPQS